MHALIHASDFFFSLPHGTHKEILLSSTTKRHQLEKKDNRCVRWYEFFRHETYFLLFQHLLLNFLGR